MFNPYQKAYIVSAARKLDADLMESYRKDQERQEAFNSTLTLPPDHAIAKMQKTFGSLLIRR